MSEEIKIPLSGEDTLDFAMFSYGLGVQFAEWEQFPDAYSRIKSAYEKIEKGNLLPASDPKRLEILDALAGVAERVGHYLEERGYRTELLKGCKEHFGKDAPEVIIAMEKLARCHQILLDYEEEMKVRQQILSKCRRIYGETSFRTIEAWANLCISLVCLDPQGKLLRNERESIASFASRMISEYKNSSEKMDEDGFSEMANLVEELIICLGVDEREEKSRMEDELLQLAREIYPPESEFLVQYLEGAAPSKTIEEGRRLLREALAIRKKHAESDVSMMDAWSSFYENCSMIADDEGMNQAKEEKRLLQQKQLLEFRETHEKVGDRNDIPVLLEEAELLHQTDDDEGELACLKKALDLCRREDTEETLGYKGRIVDFLYLMNREESVDVKKEILQSHRSQGAEKDVVIDDLLMLSGFLRHFDQYEEALSTLREAIGEMWHEFSPGKVIEVMECMVDCLNELELYEEKLELCSTLSAMNRDFYGDESEDAVYAMEHEAKAAEETDEMNRAIRMRKTIYRIRRRNYGDTCSYTVDAYHQWIRLLCLAGRYRKASKKQRKMVRRLGSCHPLIESRDLAESKKQAQYVMDACMVLFHTKKAEKTWEKEVLQKSVASLKEEDIGEFPILKREILMSLWKEAHGGNMEKCSVTPWETETADGRSGFWARVEDDLAVLYYADENTDYIFDVEEGWKKYGFQKKLGWDGDYDKVSEDFSLQQAWNFGYDIGKFFVARPWEKNL